MKEVKEIKLDSKKGWRRLLGIYCIECPFDGDVKIEGLFPCGNSECLIEETKVR